MRFTDDWSSLKLQPLQQTWGVLKWCADDRKTKKKQTKVAKSFSSSCYNENRWKNISHAFTKLIRFLNFHTRRPPEESDSWSRFLLRWFSEVQSSQQNPTNKIDATSNYPYIQSYRRSDLIIAANERLCLELKTTSESASINYSMHQPAHAHPE